MNERIQLTFPNLTGSDAAYKANRILQGLRDRGYKYIGVFPDPEMPIAPGQFYVCKIEHLYAIINVKTEEINLTAEDMELLSSVLV